MCEIFLPFAELRDLGITDSCTNPQCYEEILAWETNEMKSNYTSPCQSTDYDGERKVKLFYEYVHSPGIKQLNGPCNDGLLLH